MNPVKNFSVLSFCGIVGPFILYFVSRVMAKKLLILILISLFPVPSFLPPVYSLLFHPSDQPLPIWWEIKILLTSNGNYRVEEENSTFSGHYSFTLRWTGCMEKDDGDYLLYYENSELVSFKAEEKGIFPDSTKIISTDDFADKPYFKLNYILRKGKNLHFDFFVKGFLVPKNESEHKLQLSLPASKKNYRHSSEIDYNLFVTKGSNLIFLEEKEIYLDTVKKNFAWKWKFQKPPLPRSIPSFFSSSHDVKVEVCLDPHF
jgi:hypothetical protein